MDARISIAAKHASLNIDWIFTLPRNHARLDRIRRLDSGTWGCEVMEKCLGNSNKLLWWAMSLRDYVPVAGGNGGTRARKDDAQEQAKAMEHCARNILNETCKGTKNRELALCWSRGGGLIDGYGGFNAVCFGAWQHILSRAPAKKLNPVYTS
ncbi:uncharacterized protein EI90DRAFT_3039127 [Cantharellus anzutake]|uniref:uncharacterized protein n=1 Tax=Cantharellus anzutake TaxID=1750568 RepID=UPI001907B115|nr:uncharacterized protein EI90DRAFT_3039127 [Cantharellus anzutake]KAF8338779.1 hypothetical protein EI90DRAFT_3039127 [Cantharellus anzutake]